MQRYALCHTRLVRVRASARHYVTLVRVRGTMLHWCECEALCHTDLSSDYNLLRAGGNITDCSYGRSRRGFITLPRPSRCFGCTKCFCCRSRRGFINPPRFHSAMSAITLSGAHKTSVARSTFEHMAMQRWMIVAHHSAFLVPSCSLDTSKETKAVTANVSFLRGGCM